MLGRLRRLVERTVIPRSLFWRSLLIVVVPLLILQILLTYVFYNRHWDNVTRWLAFGVAGEVALLSGMREEPPGAPARGPRSGRPRRNAELEITLIPGGRLKEA